MRKAENLTGLPVIVQNRRAGRVIQVKYSPDLTHLDGLWMNAGVRGSRLISAESISLIGQVSIMADDCGKRARFKPSPLFLRAVSTDGKRLGVITGAVIDEISFRVEALELSRGWIDDLLYGRMLVHSFTLNSDTQSVVLDGAELKKEVVRK